MVVAPTAEATAVVAIAPIPDANAVKMLSS